MKAAVAEKLVQLVELPAQLAYVSRPGVLDGPLACPYRKERHKGVVARVKKK